MADTATKPPPPAPPSAHHDDDAVERRSLRDYYIILRERLWIALPLAVLVSVGYGYRKMQVAPEYFAAATMKFDKPERVVTTVGVREEGINSDVELNTQIRVLESQMLRARVVDAITPDEQKILQRAALKHRPPGSPPPPVRDLIGRVN